MESNKQVEIIEALAEQNGQRLRRLSQRGELPSEAQLLKVRLDVLTDFVIGNIVRTAFEAAYQQRLSGYIDWVEEQNEAESGLVIAQPASVAEALRGFESDV